LLWRGGLARMAGVLMPLGLLLILRPARGWPPG
jgi:hypothetical protein